MKRLSVLFPLLSTLACAQADAGDTLRTVLLIGAGVASVVLLILFGKPNASKKQKSEKE